MLDESGKVCSQCSRERRSVLMAGALLLFGSVSAWPATIFNSIETPLPGNVSSVGFQATSAREFGDGVIFASGPGQLVSEVKVVMSSWGCTSGAWYNALGSTQVCVTTPGARFNQDLTLNIYAVAGTTPGAAPGALLKTVTRTFSIPYRPSTDVRCRAGGPAGGTGTQWYSTADNKCYNGIASIVSFNNLSLNVSQDRVIITIAFNTSTWGYNPIGTSAPCFSTPQGCPYDSLNVSAQGNAILGANVDPNGVWANWGNASSTCSGAGPTNVLVLDSSPGCWIDFHPQIQVNTANDVLQIRYMSNLTNGDGVINITNTGLNGNSLFGPGFGPPTGNLCINAYAFSPDEQLISCCSCLVTPNGLVHLTANNDLVSNTLTGLRPNSIVVKLVSTGAGSAFNGTDCSNSAAQAGLPSFPLAGGMLSWGTTVHSASNNDPNPAGPFSITETPFLPATLSREELYSVTNRCTNIIGNGSTFGQCRSCRLGGLGGSKL